MSSADSSEQDSTWIDAVEKLAVYTELITNDLNCQEAANSIIACCRYRMDMRPSSLSEKIDRKVE